MDVFRHINISEWTSYHNPSEPSQFDHTIRNHFMFSLAIILLNFLHVLSRKLLKIYHPFWSSLKDTLNRTTIAQFSNWLLKFKFRYSLSNKICNEHELQTNWWLLTSNNDWLLLSENLSHWSTTNRIIMTFHVITNKQTHYSIYLETI